MCKMKIRTRIGYSRAAYMAMLLNDIDNVVSVTVKAEDGHHTVNVQYHGNYLAIALRIRSYEDKIDEIIFYKD